DRSMPLVMITKVMPTESTRRTAVSMASRWKLNRVGKASGARTLNTMIRARRTRNIQNVLAERTRAASPRRWASGANPFVSAVDTVVVMRCPPEVGTWLPEVGTWLPEVGTRLPGVGTRGGSCGVLLGQGAGHGADEVLEGGVGGGEAGYPAS